MALAHTAMDAAGSRAPPDAPARHAAPAAICRGPPAAHDLWPVIRPPLAAPLHSDSHGALDLARIAGRAARRRAGTSITGGSGPSQNIGIVDNS
jgi:hypothetical protein